MALFGNDTDLGGKQDMDRVDVWPVWLVAGCVAGGLASLLGLIYLVTWTVKHAWFS